MLDTLQSAVGLAAPFLGGLVVGRVADPAQQCLVTLGAHCALLVLLMVLYPPFGKAATQKKEALEKKQR